MTTGIDPEPSGHERTILSEPPGAWLCLRPEVADIPGFDGCEQALIHVDEAKCAILLHGLCSTSRSLNRTAEALQAAGPSPVNLDYPSRKQTIETLANITFVHFCKAATSGSVGKRRFRPFSAPDERAMAPTLDGIRILRCFFQNQNRATNPDYPVIALRSRGLVNTGATLCVLAHNGFETKRIRR